MPAPWYIYLLGIICAIPIYALVVIGTGMAIRLFAQWLVDGNSEPRLATGGPGKAKRKR